MSAPSLEDEVPTGNTAHRRRWRMAGANLRGSGTNSQGSPRRSERYGMASDARTLKATEEGLAMIHEAMHLPSLLLARPALYYYASARASVLSFVELFKELEEWVEDEGKRFDICALVKRGVRDTNKTDGCVVFSTFFTRKDERRGWITE